MLRASAGSAGDERIAHLPDDDLVGPSVQDLRRTMGLTGARPRSASATGPTRCRSTHVGHPARVADIEATLAVEHAAPVVLTGAAYGGVGLPACIHHARAGRSAAPRHPWLSAPTASPT